MAVALAWIRLHLFRRSWFEERPQPEAMRIQVNTAMCRSCVYGGILAGLVDGTETTD